MANQWYHARLEPKVEAECRLLGNEVLKVKSEKLLLASLFIWSVTAVAAQNIEIVVHRGANALAPESQIGPSTRRVPRTNNSACASPSSPKIAILFGNFKKSLYLCPQ